jgi:hypothetical protein
MVAVGVEWAECSEPATAHCDLWPGYWVQGVTAKLSADHGERSAARPVDLVLGLNVGGSLAEPADGDAGEAVPRR